MRANETYSDAKRQFSVRHKDVLMNAQSPRKQWSTLKFTVFGMSSSYTMSGFIGKVIASHAAVAPLIPAEVALIYTKHEALRGYCP